MLNFAVIGVGRMGKRHAFNLAHGLLAGVRLCAVCDIDKNALDWCAKHTPRARAYTNFFDMLAKENLDGVIIATPHYQHEEIAVACINNGVNTLIEKPLAVSVDAAHRIVAAHIENPSVKVGVSFNQRSNKMYRRAKKLLDSGKMGEIQRVNFTITDWYRSQAYYNQGGWRASWCGEGGGCMINQCVHQLDILQWLVGMPLSVRADCATIDRNISTENDVTAVFDYGGFKCAFSASTHEIKGTNRLEIACDKGKIVIGTAKMRVFFHRSQKDVNATTVSGYGFTPSRGCTFGYGLLRAVNDLIKGQQLRSVRAFRNDILGKGRMLASVEEGVKTVELINAVYLSSAKSDTVKLPINSDEYIEFLDTACKNE